ncbi:LysR family transcriptional regulator [Sphingobium boeckii]|uniref:Molybdate transport repressor ModE-like protein n=1 Tax=Sphingobium boeckii TaxID=1082345 RepID=A0A7W9EGK5_9SPHN|nr:LysR family transcriptional regulator [Sphingobium boeckii]MBB5686811.1 molybdate transport repressor ModE-like protein [Sphingobium boeckii]
MSILPQWDDLRLFLAIARAGRMTAAARQVGLDQTTLARRLNALEAVVGSKLAERSPRGIRLTEAGGALVAFAERMEAEVSAATHMLGGLDAAVSGTVRLATPEAFGTFLLAPHVPRLSALHPELHLELSPQSRLVSLVNREADIAITLNRPPKGKIVAKRLVDYRIGLYASRDYLAAHGAITNADQAAAHPFAWYIDDMLELPELRYLREIMADARPVFRSSSIAAQQAAVAAGLGLGLLHVFAAEADERLIRILPEQVEIIRSYWMVMHADQQKLPRIRAVVDFLNDLVARNRASF